MAKSIAGTNSLSSTPNSVKTMKVRKGERKEVDSPRTTQTDVSSSCDDERSLLMTPPLMTSRLGRIVISSCSSSTDGSNSTTSSNVVENGDDERSRTSSHRRLNVRRTINNRSQQQQQLLDEEIKNQSQGLISALHQLHRLATLDSTEYQQRLLENTLPDLQTENPNSLYCPAPVETSSSSTQISQLSQPIQTPLVQLSMSIHRLHAAVANITREVDGHTDEVQELQSQLSALRRRNQQVETAAKKVHKTNLKLKQQSSHDRKTALGLRHKVQQYEARLDSQGFQLMASKVHQHEIQLQLSKTQHSNNSNSNSNNGSDDERGQLRERIDSNMSEFLDIEEDSYDDVDNGYNSESVQTTTTTDDVDAPTKPDSSSINNGNENENQHHARSDSFVSIRSDLSERTEENRKTVGDADLPSSLPSETTLPTFRFSAEGYIAPDRSGVNEVIPNKSNDSPKKKTTRFSGKEQQQRTGIADATTETGNNVASFSNRFAKFLGARAIPNYNLKLVPPCNIQFVAIPLNNTPTERSKKEKQSLSNTEVIENHDTVVQTNNDESPSAFAVCGLDGFDTDINMKPTVGAQLAKINGKTVDPRWTLETLYSELGMVSGASAKKYNNRAKKQIVLTFRNEIWDVGQTKVLNAAIRKVESNGAATSWDSSHGKEKRTDGASLFENHHQKTNNHSNNSSEDPPQADGVMATTNDDPIQRVRTASTDSMGKAIHGIGNFLHNLNHVEGGR